MWLITILLGAVIYFLINYWINSKFNDWKRRGIPYSPSTSPIKMILKFVFTKKGMFDLMTEDYKRMEGHRFVGFFQMFTPGIMIRDPDLINRICIKDFSYFVDRNHPFDTSDLFTESVSSLTGDKWRALRHKLTPTLTSGKLKTMFKPIKECCYEVVEFINKKNGQEIEARDFMFKYGINVIGKSSFGLKIDALNEEIEKDNQFLKISKRFFNPSFMLILKFMMTIAVPKIRKYLYISLVDKDVDVFFRKLVHDMIDYREKTGETRQDFLQLLLENKAKEQMAESNDKQKSDSFNDVSVEPEDNELLDQLKYMQTGEDNFSSIQVFTDNCIVSQIFMFISVGSETTAMSLSFIFFELAVNPDCQKKLQDEVDEVVGKNGFNYDALKNMKYMDKVINEAMRIHVALGFLTRICTKNYRIPDSDVVIEKGTFVAMPTMCTSNDPLYFQNPKTFDPERFDDSDKMHPGVFLPFGSGPRMCIAKRLAILEMKTLLATLMQNFTIELSPKTKMPLKIRKFSIFQNVDGGIWIKFQKRK